MAINIFEDVIADFVGKFEPGINQILNQQALIEELAIN